MPTHREDVRTYGELVEELLEKRQLSHEEEAEILRPVLGLVPLNGATTTQKQISEAMPAAEPDRVTRAIDLLRDGGLVTTGRGRSRSVSRRFSPYKNEHSLYPHMSAEIRTQWADEWPHDYIEPDRFSEVLLTHGAKRGRWGAPDITLVGGKTLPFLPGRSLDVVTFEVKPLLDITGLYEALSHRTHATHSYLICHHPASEGEPGAADVGRISREAQRTGVGFILARQPNDYATWEEIAPATRWQPEPEMLHDFVVSLDRNMLRRLRSWLRSDSFLGQRPAVDFSALGLTEKEQRLAEDIYLEIPVDGTSVGWRHFRGWICKAEVEKIRERLKEEGIIKVVQGGGMRLS